MNTLHAVNLAGSVKALAALLGITHQSIYKWDKDVPAGSLARLQELRPEWFQK